MRTHLAIHTWREEMGSRVHVLIFDWLSRMLPEHPQQRAHAQATVAAGTRAYIHGSTQQAATTAAVLPMVRCTSSCKRAQVPSIVSKAAAPRRGNETMARGQRKSTAVSK